MSTFHLVWASLVADALNMVLMIPIVLGIQWYVKRLLRRQQQVVPMARSLRACADCDHSHVAHRGCLVKECPCTRYLEQPDPDPKP